jgi:hypothetical protein
MRKIKMYGFLVTIDPNCPPDSVYVISDGLYAGNEAAVHAAFRNDREWIERTFANLKINKEAK